MAVVIRSQPARYYHPGVEAKVTTPSESVRWASLGPDRGGEHALRRHLYSTGGRLSQGGRGGGEDRETMRKGALFTGAWRGSLAGVRQG